MLPSLALGIDTSRPFGKAEKAHRQTALKKFYILCARNFKQPHSRRLISYSSGLYTSRISESKMRKKQNSKPCMITPLYAFTNSSGVVKLIGISAARERDNFQLLLPFSPIDGSAPWAVKIDVPWETLMAPANKLADQLDAWRRSGMWQIIMFGALLGILALLLSAVVIHKSLQPLKTITLMIKEIGSGDGDLTKRVNYRQPNELGDLSACFNRFLTSCIR